MNRLIRSTAFALSMAAVLLPGVASAAPSPTVTASARTPSSVTPSLDLPAPRGPHDVGTSVLQLVDRHRTDPWNPSAGARQVRTTLFYPTRQHGGRAYPYASAAESAAYLDFQQKQDPSLSSLPRDLLAKVTTHARVGGRPEPGRHPLVLLSPGFSLPASTLTGVATELASRGYVVASLDHPYESSGTTLADGTLAPCLACDTDDYAAVPRVRKLDVRFVLQRLLAGGSKWRPLIDPRRVGMAGHSIGGNSAAVAGVRVRAAANLDGTFFEPVSDRRRPLLMLGSQDHRPGGEDASWDETWRRHRGPGAWLTVDGSNHGTFTDVPALADQLGVRPVPGAVDGARGLRITRAVLVRFFDRFLRGRDVTVPRFPDLERDRVRF